MEECNKFMNDEIYNLDIKGLFHFIKSDLILKEKYFKYTPL